MLESKKLEMMKDCRTNAGDVWQTGMSAMQLRKVVTKWENDVTGNCGFGCNFAA